jgi:hypothetical protein
MQRAALIRHWWELAGNSESLMRTKWQWLERMGKCNVQLCTLTDTQLQYASFCDAPNLEICVEGRNQPDGSGIMKSAVGLLMIKPR